MLVNGRQKNAMPLTSIGVALLAFVLFGDLGTGLDVYG